MPQKHHGTISRSSATGHKAVSPPANGPGPKGGQPPGGDDECRIPPEACPLQGVDQIIPIKLEWQTIAKLVAPALLAVIGVIAAAAIFYANTRAHLGDRLKHFTLVERQKLETKESGRIARFKLLRDLKKDNAIRVREIKVEQREQIQTLGSQLQAEQQKILREVRRTRRAIR